MKTFLTLLFALVPFVSFAQPILRNPMTTNRFMLALPSNGQVPAWNAAAGRWSNSTISASGGGDQVWTNVSGVIQTIVDTNLARITTNGTFSLRSGLTVLNPSAANVSGSDAYILNTATNFANSGSRLLSIKNFSTNVFEISALGEVAIGKNTEQILGNPSPGTTLQHFNATALGDPNLILFSIGAGDKDESMWKGLDVMGDSNSIALIFYADDDPVANLEPTAAAAATPYFFNTTLDHTSGNLVEVQNLSTDKFTVAWDGAVTLASTTNHITFGATNAPPASAVAPTRWISVLINGEATQYKIPLYE